ncbi:Uncharacterized conserved protein YndB, AHSA1/START domain [Friedmanniella luteola]|uniref:Uncharacterized conserved protein YndB, AHSA1/START domain n=1 Tax=Friedmanniella luteola TaxID=546871 RepID=A0A1H1SK36_9ACTN|nr:SRPBCC domain-containing protein [Friedmanniella luteola]SDS48096.1 Uncharacterized conserved protein YndB, AHSA1/START domain [Friedmanniella luteola]
MIDLQHAIAATTREVNLVDGPDGEDVRVLLRRRYRGAVPDIWDALTTPDRLARWFLPVTGDLTVGGSFQLEGNAGGDVLACEPPHRFRVTFGGPTSVVEVRLRPADEPGATLVEVQHTVPRALAGSGAGALYAGPGWDEALLHLGLLLEQDPPVRATPEQDAELGRRSVPAWVEVVRASGTATSEEVEEAAAVAAAQYAPDPVG